MHASRAVRGRSEFPPQFWLLTAGILVYAIGVDMCFPFETLFLNGRLHISMTTVGLLLGITGLAGLPFQVLGGAFADRFGRRGVLVAARSSMSDWASLTRWPKWSSWSL